MSGRFVWGPPTKLRVGEAVGRPRTAPDLLAVLGVEELTPEDQRIAVSEWLNHHEADALMRTSLRRCGFDVPGNDDVTVIDGTDSVASVMPWSSGLISVYPQKAFNSYWEIEIRWSVDRGWSGVDTAEQPVRYWDGIEVA